MAHGTQTQTSISQGEALSIAHRLLYSYAEARELLGGVPLSTFALWIAKGIIEPVKIGPRRCFVRYEDILRLAGGYTLPKAG